MTPLKYIQEQGAATSGELIALARQDKAALETLKRWAIEEATAKGITLEVSGTAA